jgi:Domain of unknown function (DUF4350)
MPSVTGGGSLKFKMPFWGWALIGLLCLSLIIVAVAPKSYPGGSSYDQSLSGYAQWYRFMESQHHPIQRWRRAYGQLKGEGQTLIQVADVESFKEPNLESSEIMDWVKRGNTLVVLAWEGDVTGAPFRSDLPTPKGAVRIETTRRDRDQIPEVDRNYAHYTVLLKDRFGAVIVAESFEKGTVIRCVYPWIGAGSYAKNGVNFEILADLATRRKGTIWVDEWLHGNRDLEQEPNLAQEKRQDLWDYFARRPIAVVAGQGTLLLLLLLWGQNQRFGKLLRIDPPPRNSSEQYIQALADTLNTHGHTEYVLALLGQSLRDRLRSHLGLLGTIPTVEGDRAIATEWAMVTGRPSAELLELLQQSRSEQRLGDNDLIAWVQQADTILRGLS